MSGVDLRMRSGSSKEANIYSISEEQTPQREDVLSRKIDLEFKSIDLPTTFRIIASICRTNIRNAQAAVNQPTTKQAQTTQPHQTGQTAGTTKKWHVHFHENNGPPSLVIIAPHAVFVTTCYSGNWGRSTVSPTPNSQRDY